jgi:hypothetical protein
MAKVSKFIKLDKNILFEYIYDDGNLISEAYDILVNSRDKKRSYIATSTSGTYNTQGNSLFRLDAVTNKYGKVDPNTYSFLSVKNFSSGIPIRHDTLKFHLPVNWTFGEYLGFYVKVFGFDVLNQQTFELANFYFDMTDVSQQYLLNFTSPPLLYQEKLWGKNIKIEVPALYELSNQTTGSLPTANSINANLTDGIGLSTTTPIFVDFHFISNIQTINAVSSYLLTPKISTSLPQVPEFQNLSLVIEHSSNGDFFEVYGTYNGTIAGFKQFIDDSVLLGNRYYVQYDITLFEQNIRGKTITLTVTESFNETIEYRPIIKYSTTTAIIDVEMRLIDAVDDSYIVRRASYGMLQDEVSKYSLSLMKINLSNAYKPKVYNIKNSIDPSTVGLSNALGISKAKKGLSAGDISGGNLTISGDISDLGVSGALGGAASNFSTGGGASIETIKVPFPVLVDRYNVIAKSENTLFNSKIYFGLGKMQILLYPFDNVVGFNIATGTADVPNFLDMTGYGEIKFVIKNDKESVEFPLYTETGQIELSIGQIAFKVTQGKFGTIKKIYEGGVNLFYITSYSQEVTSVVYTGLFKIYDNRNNITELNNQAAASVPSVIQDPSLPTETALVTRTRTINTGG